MKKSKKVKSYLIKNRIGVKKYIDWDKVVVTNTVPMSGEQITKTIFEQTGVKITRQGVSTAIKLALRKAYINMKRMEKSTSPFDCALRLFEILHPNCPSIEDAGTFFSLFPEDIQREIRGGLDGR